MTAEDPNGDGNEAFDREIPSDPARGIERAKDNYKLPEMIPFYEGSQNGYEAINHNKEMGAVPEDRSLHIVFVLDTETGTLVQKDNAGGVGGEDVSTEEKLWDNYLGFDKPGKEKREGDKSGGYGRGQTTVLALGEDGFYVETLHDGTRVSTVGNMTLARANYPSVENTRDELDASGTYAEIEGIPQELVDKMADRERVHAAVRKKFPTLVSRDDVTIEYEIDGDREEIDGLDLDELRETAAIDADYPETITEFTKYGEGYPVTGIELFDGRELPEDEEPPWKGILLMNTDDDGNLELAVKKEYTPDNCRAVSQGDLFGLCDISAFCPEYEDSAHDDFSNGMTASKMGVADLLRTLSREEFSTTLDDRDVAEESRRKLNRMIDENDVFTVSDGEDAAPEGDGGTATTTEAESDGSDEIDEVETGFTAAVTQRARDSGETAEVSFRVPEEVDDEVALTNISVREIMSNDTVTGPEPIETAAGASETVEFTADKHGRYVATAALRDGDGKKVAGATAFMTVGDAPETAADAHGVQFIDRHLQMNLGEDGRKAIAYEDDDGNRVVALNQERPLHKELTERSSDERVMNNIEMLFYKWGLPAIKEWMIAKNDPDEFVDRRKANGEPADIIADEFAKMEAELVDSIDGQTDIVVA